MGMARRASLPHFGLSSTWLGPFVTPTKLKAQRSPWAGLRGYLLAGDLADWWALSDLLDLSLGPLARMPAWLERAARHARALASAAAATATASGATAAAAASSGEGR
jgi:hypothetical protein